MSYRTIMVVCCSVIALISTYPIFAADVNIKLRKTDVAELKQQLMPAFEQNIQTLNDLLICLEQGNKIDSCLEQLTRSSGRISEKGNKKRRQQIQTELEQKLQEKNISRQQLIGELKKLLLEAEQIKLCLIQGQTANELKDCIIQYGK